MKWTDEELPVCCALESAVVAVWRRNPKMSGYVAKRAYEAAHKFFRDELRGGTPTPPNAEGLDALASAAVLDAAQRLRDEGSDGSNGLKAIGHVPLEKLVTCLRELAKSVERHTKRGGSQGYLTFLDGYLR